eukprot:58611_1
MRQPKNSSLLNQTANMESRLHVLSNPYSIDYKKVILSIGVAFIGAYTLSNIMYGNRRKQSHEPRIIPGSAFFGCKPDVEHDMKSFLKACQNKHGDVFTLRMGNGEYSTFITDNKLMKRVLYSKHADFNKPSMTAKLRFGLDEVVQSDHATQLLSKAFHHGFSDPDNRNKLIQSLGLHTRRILKSLCTKSVDANEWCFPTIRLHEWIRNIVIKIELHVLFGPSFANSAELMDLYFDLERAVPLRLNGGQRVMFDAEISALLHKIHALCTETEQNHNDGALPHGIAMANTFCEENHYSKDSRNRLIIAFLWGSLSNSSHAMTWMMYRILESKKCTQQIVNELEIQKHVFDAHGANDCKFKLSQIRALLPTLSSVINEVFRYYAESNICRYLLHDIVIKDDEEKQCKLRAGDWVIGSCAFLHHNPKYFENPDTFIFDRFVDYNDDDKNGFNQKQAKHLLTFGSKCSGRAFAENLIVILCGFLLHNIEFKMIEGRKGGSGPRVGPVGSFSIPAIHEDDDMRFKWRRRDSVAVDNTSEVNDTAACQSLIYGNGRLLSQLLSK